MLTHWKRPWCSERLGGRRRKGRQRMKWLDGITDLMDMSLSNSGSWWWTGRPDVLAIHGVTKSQTRLSDWTELNWNSFVGLLNMIIQDCLRIYSLSFLRWPKLRLFNSPLRFTFPISSWFYPRPHPFFFKLSSSGTLLSFLLFLYLVIFPLGCRL